MFGICMKNYFKNLKYVFTVLGIMFLAFLIGVCFFFKKTGSDISLMTSRISEAAAGTNFAIFGAEGGIETVLENYGSFIGLVLESFAESIGAILISIGIFTLIQLLGIYISNIVVFLFERFDISKTNIFRVCLEQLCRSVAICLIWVIILLVMTQVNETVGLILLLCYPLGYCFVALMSSWLTAAKDKRPAWTEYVTFKNILLLLASNLLQIVATAVIAFLAFNIFDGLVAAVILIAMIIIATATTNLNAYAFLYRETGAAVTEQTK